MSPERLGKIEKIFHDALELPNAERESFLRESCENDTALRQEVESLLAFENESDSAIIAQPAKLAAEMISVEETAEIVGKQINQYKILSLLGEGGMGAVYLAHDTSLERKVALKLLSGEFANDEVRLRRFFQEAKAASALNHPNILTVHEIGEVAGMHYIVTEYINGKTLKEHLTEEKPPLARILELAAQIASALAAAHASGIIHRDIKPDNVMVRNDQIVKILDFGIAKLTDANVSTDVDLEAATQAQAMTVPGMIIGTPQYMSPEQARGQKTDFRTDIFSFGVVLYEMIAGRPAFSGVSKMDVLGAILKDEPEPLSELVPEISYELEHIVAKTLRKDREERYQHIKDLLIDLNDAKKTLEFSPRRIHQTDSSKVAVTAETDSEIKKERRFSLVHAALLILVFGVLSAAGWWYWSSAPRETAQTEAPLKSAEIISWASTPGEFYSTGAFSPDGKMIAFASTKAGGKHLWIKQTGAGEAFQITKDEFTNEQPVWSPDAQELAFFSTRGNQTGVWRIPILGGSPKFVATIEDGGALLRWWSNKNLIYYESNHDIYAIDANSGEARAVTDLDARLIKAESINISRDERQISYVTVDDDKWSVWTMTPGGEPKKLFTSDTEIKNTAWHTDNRRIFFSRLTDGVFQIFVTDTAAAPPRQITFGEKDAFVLDTSPDGTRILYGSAKEESDIWSVGVKDSKETAVASDIDSELWASPAPDGKSIAYQSIKNLSQGNNLFSGRILVKKINSNEQPTEIASSGYLPVWSPDGQMIAFREVSGERHRIGTIRVTGGQKQLAADDVVSIYNTLLPYNRTQASDFSWSPDSRKIAYISKRSGQHNIWLTNADGSESFQLTANADAKLFFYCPVWSANGKQIAFTSRTGNSAGKPTFSVWLINAETKDLRLLTQQKKFFRLIGWSPNGAKLFLASTDESEMNPLHPEVSILQMETETGVVQPAVTLKNAYLANIHLAPDGKSVAFAAHREGRDNVWLIQISGGEEKKLTNNNDSRLYFSSLAWSPDGNTIFFGKQSRYSLLSMLTNFK